MHMRERSRSIKRIAAATYLEAFCSSLAAQSINRYTRRVQLQNGMINRQRQLLQRLLSTFHIRPLVHFPCPITTVDLLHHRLFRLLNLRRPFLVRVPISHYRNRAKRRIQIWIGSKEAAYEDFRFCQGDRVWVWVCRHFGGFLA
jgi:hypothetical protein